MQSKSHAGTARNGGGAPAACLPERPRMLVEMTADEIVELLISAGLSESRASQRVAYSPREWAEAIGVTAPTVYRWIRAGMPVVRVGAVTRIIPADAMAWIKAATVAGRAE